MNTYRVTVEAVAVATVEVEAEDEERAKRYAIASVCDIPTERWQNQTMEATEVEERS